MADARNMDVESNAAAAAVGFVGFMDRFMGRAGG
jgi:hypothetical protein